MRRIPGLLALAATAGLLGGCAYNPYTGSYYPCCGYYGYPSYRYPYYGYPPAYPYGYGYPAAQPYMMQQPQGQQQGHPGAYQAPPGAYQAPQGQPGYQPSPEQSPSGAPSAEPPPEQLAPRQGAAADLHLAEAAPSGLR